MSTIEETGTNTYGCLGCAAAPTCRTGRDNRTPAEGRSRRGPSHVVELLIAAEREKAVWKDPREARPYCQAYPLADLRQFEGFPARPDQDDVAVLHQGFTVTRSKWQGEDVLFDEVRPEGKRFSERDLGFEIPSDLL